HDLVLDEGPYRVADVALFVGEQRVEGEEVVRSDARLGSGRRSHQNFLRDRISKIEASSKYRNEALGSVKVLDFSRVLAGPFATMLLADFGAEVTKDERPGGGDETRAWGPPYDERGKGTYFQAGNRNKGSVGLDMSAEEGLAELRRPAREADVL